MKNDEFWAQYKHPNWQRKRLEVMAAADYKCQCCGDREAQLQVHHKLYIRGHAPWEYELHQLECLCEQCHDVAGVLKLALNQAVATMGTRDLQSLVAMIGGLVNHGRDALPEVCDLYADLGVDDFLGALRREWDRQA